jgi:hypothetical protein
MGKPGFTKAWRDKQKAQGLCYDCSRARAPGKSRCLDCLQSGKDLTQELSRLGICTTCRKEDATPGMKSCQACRDNVARRYRKKNPPKICPTVGCGSRVRACDVFCLWCRVSAKVEVTA